MKMQVLKKSIVLLMLVSCLLLAGSALTFAATEENFNASITIENNEDGTISVTVVDSEVLHEMVPDLNIPCEGKTWHNAQVSFENALITTGLAWDNENKVITFPVAKGGTYIISEGHIYDDSADNTCNEADCGYVREVAANGEELRWNGVNGSSPDYTINQNKFGYSLTVRPGESSIVAFSVYNRVEDFNPAKLSFEGDCITLTHIENATYNNIYQVEYKNLGTGTITYGDYTMTVNAALPSLGAYSAPEATEENYLSQVTVNATNRTFYIINTNSYWDIADLVPLAGTSTANYVASIEAYDESGDIFEVTLNSKNANNVYLSFSALNAEGGITSSIFNYRVIDNSPALAWASLSVDDEGNFYVADSAVYNTTIQYMLPAKYLNVAFSLQNTTEVFDPDKLETVGNVVLTHIEGENNNFYQVSVTGTGDCSIQYGDYIIPVSFVLPDVGLFSQPEALVENYAKTLTIAHENRTLYAIVTENGLRGNSRIVSVTADAASMNYIESISPYDEEGIAYEITFNNRNANGVTIVLNIQYKGGSSETIYGGNQEVRIIDTTSPTYEMAVDIDEEIFNAGDEITADIVLRSQSEGAAISTFQFALDIPEGLTLQSLTTPLNGSASINGGKIAYNINSITPLAVSAEGTTIATAVLKVAADFASGTVADIGLSEVEVVSSGSLQPAECENINDSLTVYNLTTTLTPNANSTLNGAAESIVLYAKYNEAGLWSDAARTIAATAPVVAANESYRLADNAWIDANDAEYADFAAIAALQPTESIEYTLQTVKTYKVYFMADAKITFAPDAVLEQVVDAGTLFGDVPKPAYTIDDNYEFDQWYFYYKTDEPITTGFVGINILDDSIIDGDIVVTAKSKAKQFVLSHSVENAEIAINSGVTADMATYNTDIVFTVEPDDMYILDSVAYQIGNGTSVALSAVDGEYTIPGSAITGNVNIIVTATKYHTVQFVAGTGVTMSAKTAYVKTNTAALYIDNSFTELFVVPVPVAAEGYRLASDNSAEPLWKDISAAQGYQTSSLGNSAVFNADTVLTAQAVKQWVVTYQAADNGVLEENAKTSEIVDEGTFLADLTMPETVADAGYEADEWAVSYTDSGNTYENDTVQSDITYTVSFKDATYAVSFPAIANVEFVGAATATHGTDYSFGITVSQGAKVTQVAYKIGESAEIVLAENAAGITSGSYKIAGEDIIGNISVLVTSNETFQITFVAGANGKIDGENSVTKTFDKNYVIQASDFVIVPGIGYKIDTWDIDPVGKEVLSNATYTVSFVPASFAVTWPEGFVGVEEATYGTDLVFTPVCDGKVVTSVVYSVENGVAAKMAIKNSDGTYTILGSDIIGDCVVEFNAIDATFDGISYEDYKGMAAGKQIAVLETEKLATGTYCLDGYGDMFYSAKYGGYVSFVDESENAESLAAKLAMNNNTVIEIKHNGDINGSNTVTAADSAAINDVLHQVDMQYVLDDKMRFELDVNGDHKVSTADILWILNIASGKGNLGN